MVFYEYGERSLVDGCNHDDPPDYSAGTLNRFRLQPAHVGDRGAGLGSVRHLPNTLQLWCLSDVLVSVRHNMRDCCGWHSCLQPHLKVTSQPELNGSENMNLLFLVF